MITEKDLQEAIAECLGKRNPDASTCIKLAAFYTIQNELYGEKPQYSFAPPPTQAETTIDYDSGSEFSDNIQGMETNEVFSVVDELMDAVKVLNPALYDATIRKLTES